VTKTLGSPTSLATLQTLSGAVTGQVTVPIYQGGSEYATIRQAKETLGQRRIDVDTARDQVAQTVTQAWGQLEAAKAQIAATTAQVAATEIALNGVREEARVGQRTTLDVLNAQQDLVNASHSSPPSATAWSPPTPCCPPPERFHRKSSGFRSRTTTRSRTIIRCAIAGLVCGRQTDGSVIHDIHRRSVRGPTISCVRALPCLTPSA
jgi:hypothetical protein